MEPTNPTAPEPRERSSSLSALQRAQAFGAFNDNAWKAIVAALALRQVSGVGESAEAEAQWHAMLPMLVFTIPLALFSLPFGAVADRSRKNAIIVLAKVAEAVLMGLGALVLFAAPEHSWLPLVILALMGVQTAAFSPAKYGILPEIVTHVELPRANGRLEAVTFIAIVAGTGLGPLLIGVVPGVPGFAGIVLFALALVGWRSAQRIERTEPARLSGGFGTALRGAGNAIRGDRALVLAILGQAWFWSIASLLGQNVAVFAKIALELSEKWIGLPLGVFALGVGIGSELCGRFAKGRVEVGFVPLGSLLLAILVLLLAILPPGIATALVVLTLLGIASGFIVVPLNALQQWRAPDEHRGSVIALSNAAAYVGMILGSLFGGLLALQGASCRMVFAACAVLTVIGTVIAVWLLPIALMRALLLVFVHSCYRLKIVGLENVPAKGGVMLTPNHVSFLDGILISVAIDRPVRFIVDRAQYERRGIKPFMKWIGAIPISQTGGPRQILRALKDAGEYLDRGDVVCIFPEGQITRTGAILPFRRGMERIVKGRACPIVPIHLDRVWGSIFSFSGLARGATGLRLPERFPYPITITLGRALSAETPVADVRKAVVDLASRAWFERKQDALPLHRSFLKRVRRRPFALALADRMRPKVSRLAAAAAALALARRLRPAWLGQERVGVLLPPSVSGATVNLAAALACRTVVNLNYTAGKAGMESAATQSGLTTVITNREFLGKAKVELPAGVQPVWIEDIAPTISRFDRFVAAAMAWFAPHRMVERFAGAEREVTVEDTFTVIFSSGSTGDPKGVMLTHFNLDTDIEAVSQIFRPLPEDRILGVLPLFHSFGTMTLWFAQLRGIPLICHPSPLDAEAVGSLVLDYRVSLLLATPTFLQLYLRRCSPEQFGSLRIVMTGAEKLPDRLAQAFEDEFGIRPLEGYGATECAPVVAASVPAFRAPGFFQAGSRRGFVGPPVPCMSAKIVDPDTFEELPLGSTGLLLVRGPNVMKGYLGREDLTSKAIRDGWYVTGDIARLDESGFIQITDRLARFSKIGGEMVPHGKVEEALHQAAGLTVQTFVVTAVADEKKGERLAVISTLDPAAIPGVLEKLATMGLPNLFLPRRDGFVKVDAIPVLGTGKVDLRAARRLAEEHVKVG